MNRPAHLGPPETARERPYHSVPRVGAPSGRPEKNRRSDLHRSSGSGAEALGRSALRLPTDGPVQRSGLFCASSRRAGRKIRSALRLPTDGPVQRSGLLWAFRLTGLFRDQACSASSLGGGVTGSGGICAWIGVMRSCWRVWPPRPLRRRSRRAKLGLNRRLHAGDARSRSIG